MISFELATKLKDAGFPQELKKGDRFYQPYEYAGNQRPFLVTHHGSDHEPDCGNGKCICECEYCYPFGCARGIKVPTLAELIEACGDDFGTLDLWSGRGGREREWRAIPWDHAPVYKAPSPEEAVARLWLALNKK